MIHLLLLTTLPITVCIYFLLNCYLIVHKIVLAEYSKDLPSYLQYCKDVVFAGSESLFIDDHEEQKMIEKLWNYYQNEKVMIND